MVEINAGFDRPDNRDWLYGALAGAETSIAIPKIVDLAIGLKLQDQ